MAIILRLGGARRASGPLSALTALHPQDRALATRRRTGAKCCSRPNLFSPRSGAFISDRSQEEVYLLLRGRDGESRVDAIARLLKSRPEALPKVSMGPCQGKMCQAARSRSAPRQKRIEHRADPRTRPSPEQPVPLGVFAGRGLHFLAERRTPMHFWHKEAGAT